MKKIFTLCIASISIAAYSQTPDELPELIPVTINQKTGYIDQQGNTIVKPEYNIAMLFSEDCHLLNSPNENVRIFGTSDYATAEKNRIVYRINKLGERVYQYKSEDKGKCTLQYEPQQYNAFVVNGFYGLISKKSIDDKKYDNFVISPTYQSLYILDGDTDDPMIIAVLDDKFGIINKKNEVIIPFIYEDIKTNLSWKTAHLFEVSTNGKDYFYINKNNHSYNISGIK